MSRLSVARAAIWAVTAAGTVVAATGIPTIATGAVTVDHKPCPQAGQLRLISPLTEVLPTAIRFARLSPARTVVRALTRGVDSPYAQPAARACGGPIVRLSVYVKIHSRGQSCSACDLRMFVVRYRHGGYRVWEAY